jgi:hypothetical protein
MKGRGEQQSPVVFPHWDSWGVWKRRNPVLSFVGKHFFSGLISAIGSVFMYIALFAIIIRLWDKMKKDRVDEKATSATLTSALQLRSPLLYNRMNDRNE